jgi:predicted HTH transcriptional regulator
VFDITENFITVTLPLNVSSKPRTTETLDISLTNTQKEIIRLITQNDTITIAELARKIKVSTTAINNAIKGLKDSGILTRTGARKNGVWVLNQ